MSALGSDLETGLTSGEAAGRLEQYRPNAIERHEEPLWHRVMRRFWGPIPWMIETAALLSAVVQKWEDFAIILVMLMVNAGLDFFQEHRALNALAAPRAGLASESIALRDGAFRTLPVRDLVPGDIVKLRIGNLVPADVKLVQGDYLSIDQAALTGESLPVSRGPGDVAYANTVVKQGEMLAAVVDTGGQTAFARELFEVAALAYRRENSDPMETPIFAWLEEHCPDSSMARLSQIHFVPFDPVRKHTEATVEDGERRFTAIKGAAQVVLELTELDDEGVASVRRSVDELAARGYRTLAVARGRWRQRPPAAGADPAVRPAAGGFRRGVAAHARLRCPSQDGDRRRSQRRARPAQGRLRLRCGQRHGRRPRRRRHHPHRAGPVGHQRRHRAGACDLRADGNMPY